MTSPHMGIVRYRLRFVLTGSCMSGDLEATPALSSTHLNPLPSCGGCTAPASRCISLG